MTFSNEIGRLPEPSASPPVGWRCVLLAAMLALAAGCGQANSAKEKPTTDEIRQMRATVEASKPVATAVSLTPLPPIYRPWGMKETIVDALGRIGEGAVPTLITALSDPTPRVRAQAARALARMGEKGKDAIPVLIQRLNDPDVEVQQMAARALGQMGPAATASVPALMTLLETVDAATPSTGAPRINRAP